VKKQTQHRIEYVAFRIIEKTIQSLPTFILKPFADFIAFLVFKIIKYRREVALENLVHAFPEKSQEERFRIAYGSYRHFALMILEFMKLASWTPEQLEKVITLERTREVEDMLAATRGRGAVVVSGHFGNWEMAIAYLASRFFEGASVIQLRQKNALVDQRVVEMRRRWGMEIIYSRGAVNNALSSLKGNQFLALLCDQDAGARGVFVPFFRRMASTPVGAAVLHLRSQAPLFFGFSVRVGKFKYKGYVTPIEYDGDYEVTTENIQKITAKFTALLEKYVREYPDQYLWLHRRWKTKPEDVHGGGG
jgi:KDO2-lipid IV(A) lauroyltransferase